jgi:hypothetical protein
VPENPPTLDRSSAAFLNWRFRIGMPNSASFQRLKNSPCHRTFAWLYLETNRTLSQVAMRQWPIGSAKAQVRWSRIGPRKVGLSLQLPDSALEAAINSLGLIIFGVLPGLPEDE